MSSKKSFSPSIDEQDKFLAEKEKTFARKKIEKLKKIGEMIDPELANAARRPGRPYKCMYPAGKKISLKIPLRFYKVLKKMSKEQDVPMRELILDAISEQYDKEIFDEE